MKTDVNGCSTLVTGEHYEEFYSSVVKKFLVQYDYRTQDGKLFSCVAPTVEIARLKRDKFLKKNS